MHYLLQSNSKGAMVSVLEVNKANTVLFSGDSFGFIYLWNIDGYCAKHKEDESPEGEYFMSLGHRLLINCCYKKSIH